ncbi:MAG: helix-turn-helix transcriptional regulator [Alphaproteobacteria bacterium]|nr:helix-turn-helix transcriptional regulator [Alphaproteobacteria bacterium]
MYIETPSDLGSAIRERRRQRSWGQQTLADQVGVSRQWIVAIEQGKPRAEIGLLLKTLQVLEIKLEIPGEARVEQPTVALSEAVPVLPAKAPPPDRPVRAPRVARPPRPPRVAAPPPTPSFVPMPDRPDIDIDALIERARGRAV